MERWEQAFGKSRGLKIKKLSDRIKEEKEMKVNNKDEEYELKSRDPSDVPKAGCALFDDL